MIAETLQHDKKERRVVTRNKIYLDCSKIILLRKGSRRYIISLNFKFQKEVSDG